MAFVRWKTWLRGAVGITAAYALALQMLLTGIAATQMAAADSASPFVICYGSHAQDGGGGNDSTRIHHASCVACAFVAFSSPVPETAAPFVRVEPTEAAPPSGPQIPRNAALHRTPRSSQGPPQSV